MVEVDKSEKDQHSSTSLFITCEMAFNLMKEGKEKKAQEKFPLEYHLIKKYQPFDIKSLSSLLAKKLSIRA